MSIPETIPDKIVVINNFKEGCEKSITFKVCIDEIRTLRNKLLKDTNLKKPLKVNSVIKKILFLSSDKSINLNGKIIKKF